MKIEDKILKNEKRAREKSLAMHERVRDILDFLGKYIKATKNVFDNLAFNGKIDDASAFVRAGADLEYILLNFTSIYDDMTLSLPKVILGWCDFYDRYECISEALDKAESLPSLRTLANQSQRLESDIFEILSIFASDSFPLSWLIKKRTDPSYSKRLEEALKRALKKLKQD